jgi:hypothetical protein
MTAPVEHVAERPSWTCRACTAPWPCPTARSELQAEFQDFPSTMVIHLHGLMGEAAHDLGTGTDLRVRFLDWVSPVVTLAST